MRLISKSRLYFIVCLMVSISILFSYRKNDFSYNNFTSNIADFVAPTERKIASIFYSLSDFKEVFYSFVNMANENEILKKRNEFLEDYYYLYKKIDAENKQLRLDLNVIKDVEYNYVTAQVIARNNNAARQQIIVNAGIKDGIKIGQLAISRNQLLGRVVYATNSTSTILLLKDNLSRIPAVSLDSKAKFIVAGNSSRFLSCSYLSENMQLKEGELIVTSSDSIEIIPGIIIGSVIVEKDHFYIKPIVNFDEIEFIKFIIQ